MATVDSYIDWTDCELVVRLPGVVSGRPIVRGTRILADTIVQDADLGSPVNEIHENYPDLPIADIEYLIDFARTHRLMPVRLRYLGDIATSPDCSMRGRQRAQNRP